VCSQIPKADYKQMTVHRLVDRCLSRVRWRRWRRLYSCATRWTSSASAWFRCNWEESSTGEHPTAVDLCRCRSRECCWTVTPACGVQWTDRFNFVILSALLTCFCLAAASFKLPEASTSKKMSWFTHGVHGADFGLVPLWASFTLATTWKQNISNQYIIVYADWNTTKSTPVFIHHEIFSTYTDSTKK